MHSIIEILNLVSENVLGSILTNRVSFVYKASKGNQKGKLDKILFSKRIKNSFAPNFAKKCNETQTSQKTKTIHLLSPDCISCKANERFQKAKKESCSECYSGQE